VDGDTRREGRALVSRDGELHGFSDHLMVVA
jgi:hypothetical protein